MKQAFVIGVLVAAVLGGGLVGCTVTLPHRGRHLVTRVPSSKEKHAHYKHHKHHKRGRKHHKHHRHCRH